MRPARAARRRVQARHIERHQPRSLAAWSSTVTPGSVASSARRPWAMASTRARIASRPIQRLAQRIGQAAAQRQRGFRRFQPRRVRSQHGRAVGTERRTVVSTQAGVSLGRKSRRTYSRPVPRGRSALRPAPASTSQPTFHVDGQLAYGLGRVHEIGDAVRRHRADRGGGIDQAAVAGSQVSAIRRTRSSSMARSVGIDAAVLV